MQSPRVKKIKIQTGDPEDGHKGIESSVTHLRSGLGLPGFLPKDTACGAGMHPPQGPVPVIFCSCCLYQPPSS